MIIKDYEEAIAIFNDCTRKMIGKSYLHKLNKSEFLCKQVHLYYTFEYDYIICVSEFNVNPFVDYVSGGPFEKATPLLGIVPLHKFREYYSPFEA